MMHDYYDIEGKPISLQEYCFLAQDPTYVTVDRSLIGDKVVSTVWLGINHSSNPYQPAIFETMVLPECEITERYSTLEDAKLGHSRIVEELDNY